MATVIPFADATSPPIREVEESLQTLVSEGGIVLLP